MHNKKIFTVLLVSLLSLSSFADQYFESIRDSLITPEHCKEFSINYFKNSEIEYVTYGIEGAKDRGFDEEIQIHRKEATLFWEGLRPKGNYDAMIKRIGRDIRLQELLEVFEGFGRELGMDYQKEGDILEVLALLDLLNKFGNEYFVAGGYEYSYADSNTLGELDLIVAHKDNCEVIVVGESKLGFRGLSKAHRQLNRFRDFRNKILKKNDSRQDKEDSKEFYDLAS